MNILDKLNGRFTVPRLTRTRIVLAVGVAMVADGLQLPFQAMPLAPEIIDVLAMALTMLLVGFHPLLLPTFIIEFIPVVDAFPMWTGCVLVVIALRKRAESATPPRMEPGTPVTAPKQGLLAEGPVQIDGDERRRD